MIDPLKEQLLTVKQARDVFPTRPSSPTIWRWILKGTKGAILESICIGGRRFTSQEACLPFIQETSEPSRNPKRNVTEERQAIRLAQSVLEQFGVKVDG